MKKNSVWFDGKFMPLKSVRVPLLTHGLHYGSGVFEGVRCYQTPAGPAVFRIKEHIDRLFNSAAAIEMKFPYSRAEIVRAAKELIRKNNLQECYIRPLIFYGEKMGLSPLGAPVHFAIAAWPWEKYLNHDRIRVHVSKFIRLHPDTAVMTAKITGYYFNSILASLDAHAHRADEAVLLDANGCIAEGPGENIFFVKGKTLVTPKPGMILAGITRDSIIKIAKDSGLKVVERNIKPGELGRFDEAFLTGTAAEITNISQIDRVIYSRKPKVSRELAKAFSEAIHGKIKKYRPWLDFVNK
ncbi:MAG: branched-chain amino acid transaminase [Patescibacteria group bacterium]|nr:branched-chain amino acid transaminase [Patescibacteria group bacterium]